MAVKVKYLKRDEAVYAVGAFMLGHTVNAALDTYVYVGEIEGRYFFCPRIAYTIKIGDWRFQNNNRKPTQDEIRAIVRGESIAATPERNRSTKEMEFLQYVTRAELRQVVGDLLEEISRDDTKRKPVGNGSRKKRSQSI